MSQEQFLDWVQRQEGRFEFDGEGPVPVTGGSRNHSLIAVNVLTALRTRLRGSAFLPLGPDAGLATAGRAVRYPDILVAARSGSGGDLLIPDVVVVFEVLSPGSERTDRIAKVREYGAVPSIRRYVMLEQAGIGALSLERGGDARAWTARALVAGETLDLPEIGIAIPILEFYEDVELAAEPTGSGAGV